MKQFASPYFAAIDLGSNSFHMLIARANEHTIEIIDREKQMVQIARGLDPQGNLEQESQDRAITCLARFAERLRDIPSSQIRAVGTKTLRTAHNSHKFLKAAQNALGVPIQIISGYEEARLVYAGLANAIGQSKQRLVIDIGGGSTEFIIGLNHEPLHLESLPLGCVAYSEAFFNHRSGISKHSMRAAYYTACAELEEIRKDYLKTGWELVYGTSGTMKAIADLLVDIDGGAIITKESLKFLIKQTLQDEETTLANVAKLRREVIPAGMAILEAIFDQLKLDSIQVADATLKEGLIHDTLGRFSDKDSRVKTVAALLNQYKIDKEQAKRVEALAKKFWFQIEGPALPGVSRTKILSWAAQLHEIGLSVSHSSHHHHGFYILRYSDLAGFGRYEQTILSNLVRSHRKKLAYERFEGMDDSTIPGFIPLLICIRLAALLCRRREDPEAVPSFEINKNTYILSFSENWLSEHPLTSASLEQEVNYLEGIGIMLTVKG